MLCDNPKESLRDMMERRPSWKLFSGDTFIEECRDVRAAMNEVNRMVDIISSVSYYFFFFNIISFATLPSVFNILLAHAKEEAKNEVRSKIRFER